MYLFPVISVPYRLRGVRLERGISSERCEEEGTIEKCWIQEEAYPNFGVASHGTHLNSKCNMSLALQPLINQRM